MWGTCRRNAQSYCAMGTVWNTIHVIPSHHCSLELVLSTRGIARLTSIHGYLHKRDTNQRNCARGKCTHHPSWCVCARVSYHKISIAQRNLMHVIWTCHPSWKNSYYVWHDEDTNWECKYMAHHLNKHSSDVPYKHSSECKYMAHH